MAEIWGAVVLGGATLAKGWMDSKAAKKAGNTAAAGADRAADVNWEIFNQARADNEPFRQAGLTGLNQYMALLGLPTASVTNAVSGGSSAMSPSGAIEWFNPASASPQADPESYRNDPLYKQAWDEVWAYHNGRFDKTSDRNALSNHLQSIYTRKLNEQKAAQQKAAPGTSGKPMTQQQAFDVFRNTPGYQFGLTEGQKALSTSASAAGGLFSGKAGKDLVRFGQNYADQQGYTPYMNRLASLAGIGQTATSQNQQAGQQTANNVGQSLINAGNARASGIQGSADAWGGTLRDLAGIGGYMYGNRWGGI